MILGNYFETRKRDKEVLAYDINNMPIFEQVEIETQNRCNGKCSFCPVNVTQPQRPYAKMTEALFKKIIEDLVEVNYRGSICFSSNNEPLLDDRIEQFILYAKEKIPNAYFYMWTNGTLLTGEKLEHLSELLDKMYIDCYSNDGKMSDEIQKLVEQLNAKKMEYKIYTSMKLDTNEKITFLMRDVNEILSSRGGQAPNKNNVKASKMKCLRPFQNMIIRPDGKISLCCSDPLGKYTMGDVNETSLSEIWKNSKEFYRVRKEFQLNEEKILCFVIFAIFKNIIL